MIEQGERDELIKALNRFNEKAEQVIRSNSSASTIHVTAGGSGIWLCAGFCAVVVVALSISTPIAVGAYLDTRAEVRSLRDSERAIRAYINAGILKPVPEEKDDGE